MNKEIITAFQKRVLDELSNHPNGKTGKGLSKIVYANTRDMLGAHCYENRWEHGLRVARIHDALRKLEKLGIVKQEGKVNSEHEDWNLFKWATGYPNPDLWFPKKESVT